MLRSTQAMESRNKASFLVTKLVRRIISSRTRCFASANLTASFRRDFRQAKLDLTTGNVIRNPVVWANTAVQFEVTVKRFLKFLSGSFFSVGASGQQSIVLTDVTDSFWWLLDSFVHSSDLSWTRRYFIDANDRNTDATENVSRERMLWSGMLWPTRLVCAAHRNVLDWYRWVMREKLFSKVTIQ